MGVMFYGTNSYKIEIDDRPLTHLKIALLSSMRAGKSVAFSFDRSANNGGGRETLWITPMTDVRFRFYGSRPPVVNTTWVKAILDTADMPTGFRLVVEPVEKFTGSETLEEVPVVA